MTSTELLKLFRSQLAEWPLAKANFDALEKVRDKEFQFNGFTIKVQFNPSRIQSSSAKVDNKSVQERKCFLCPDNLPKEQRGIPFKEKYQMLVNPYPIFPKHFTIPTYQHTDQLIIDKYEDMLDLAKFLEDYIIFYNGSRCGASAPDHTHFQAGNKGFLSIDKELKKIQKESIIENLYALKNYLRNSFLIKSPDKKDVISIFQKLYFSLEVKEGDKEPMMNILTWYENNTWYSYIIPRKKHRPSCFFAEGNDNLLISPAAVDMGGLLVTPLEKDFNKITEEDIKEIFENVCISNEQMQIIIDKLKKS